MRVLRPSDLSPRSMWMEPRLMRLLTDAGRSVRLALKSASAASRSPRRYRKVPRLFNAWRAPAPNRARIRACPRARQHDRQPHAMPGRSGANVRRPRRRSGYPRRRPAGSARHRTGEHGCVRAPRGTQRPRPRWRRCRHLQVGRPAPFLARASPCRPPTVVVQGYGRRGQARPAPL